MTDNRNLEVAPGPVARSLAYAPDDLAEQLLAFVGPPDSEFRDLVVAGLNVVLDAVVDAP